MPYFEMPERRIHRVFFSRNTEYHLRRDTCVAVRDRRTGRWDAKHAAVGRRVTAVVTFRGRDGRRADLPPGSNLNGGVGGALYFDHGAVMTGIIRGIARPSREIVSVYPQVGRRSEGPTSRPAESLWNVRAHKPA